MSVLTRYVMDDGYYSLWEFKHMWQWLALTPPAVVKAHLGVSDATIALLSKTKQTVVGPDPNLK